MKKLIFILCVLYSCVGFTAAEDYFVIEIKTDNPGVSNDNSFTIPTSFLVMVLNNRNSI